MNSRYGPFVFNDWNRHGVECLLLLPVVLLGCGGAASLPAAPTPQPAPPVQQAAPPVEEPQRLLELWKSLVDSDDAIAEALDPERGVADIGLLDSDIEITSDDAKYMYERHQEAAREEDSPMRYESYEDFIDGEGIEVYDGPEAESEWARLACTVADVRVLIDAVAARENAHFECDDKDNSCTLYGDHDTSTVRIGFERSKLVAFARADIAGRSDEGTEEIFGKLDELSQTLAKQSCSKINTPPASSPIAPRELEPAKAVPAEAVAEATDPIVAVSPVQVERAGATLREAVRKKRFKGIVDHLVDPNQRIKLSFGVVEGSHGVVDFLEDESRHVVGAKALYRAMRRLQSGDMPVVLIGKKLRCSSHKGTHRCDFGVAGFGYEANIGPVERSLFAVEFGAAGDGALFIRKLEIRTDT